MLFQNIYRACAGLLGQNVTDSPDEKHGESTVIVPHTRIPHDTSKLTVVYMKSRLLNDEYTAGFLSNVSAYEEYRVIPGPIPVNRLVRLIAHDIFEIDQATRVFHFPWLRKKTNTMNDNNCLQRVAMAFNVKTTTVYTIHPPLTDLLPFNNFSRGPSIAPPYNPVPTHVVLLDGYDAFRQTVENGDVIYVDLVFQLLGELQFQERWDTLDQLREMVESPDFNEQLRWFGGLHPSNAYMHGLDGVVKSSTLNHFRFSYLPLTCGGIDHRGRPRRIRWARMYGGSELDGIWNRFKVHVHLGCRTDLDDGYRYSTSRHHFTEVVAYIACTLRYNAKWRGGNVGMVGDENPDLRAKRAILNDKTSLVELRFQKER